MQALDSTTPPMSPNTPPQADLGPLSWVMQTLRDSLHSVRQTLGQFGADVAAASGSHVTTLDTSPLRLSSQALHESMGALELVERPAAAHILGVMERCVQRFITAPQLCTEAALAAIEQASVSVLDYLASLLKGRNDYALGLYQAYRAVAELAELERIHPADLWDFDWTWKETQLPETTSALDLEQANEALYAAVLELFRSGGQSGAQRLGEVALALALHTPHGKQARVLWQLLAAAMQAQGAGALSFDDCFKHMLSRVTTQHTLLEHGRGVVSARLAQDLLFFATLGYNQLAREQDLPLLHAVVARYGLGSNLLVDYAHLRYGVVDAAVRDAAREQIAMFKGLWSDIMAGDTAKIPQLEGAVMQLSVGLQALWPQEQIFMQQLQDMACDVHRTAMPPSEDVGMEVATSVLFLEAALEDYQPDDTLFSERVATLAHRLRVVQRGEPPEPLTSWMEALYLRMNDRDTIGQVVSESRLAFGEIEQALDAFVRKPDQWAQVQAVRPKFGSMASVLAMLGLDQASAGVIAMAQQADMLLETARAHQSLDDAASQTLIGHLSQSMGTLGFLLDMLGYQPEQARAQFVFDAQLQELRHMASSSTDSAPRAQTLGADLAEPDADAPDQTPPAASVAQPQAAPAAALSPAEKEFAPAAPQQPPPPAPATTPAAPDGIVDALLEDDLRDIFLEEAQEVITNGLQTIEALRAAPDNNAQLTTLRRAFHTLKGSGRMVGLASFGEAAWEMERVFNGWLADGKPASPALLDLAQDALQTLGHWRACIAQDAHTHWHHSQFAQVAQAFLNDGTYLPLAQTTAAAAAAEPAPPAAPTPAPTETTPPAEDTAALPALPELLPVDDAALSFAPPSATPADDAALFAEDAAASLPALPGLLPVDDAALSLAPPSATPADDAALFAEDLAASLPTLPEAPPADDAALFATDDAALPALAETPEDDASADTLLFAPEEPTQAPALPNAPPAEPPAAALQAAPEAESAAAAEPCQDSPPASFSTPTVQSLWVDTQTQQALLADMVQGMPEDQVKVMGHVRVPISLFNAYLTEADTWSRQLLTDASEWELQHASEIAPENMRRLAHSLVGSSATMGLTGLASLARGVDHALSHLQRRHATQREAQILRLAAETLRHDLHQSAAGFAPRPDILLIEQLAAIIDDKEPLSDEALLQARRNQKQRATAAPTPQESASPQPLAAHDAPPAPHSPAPTPQPAAVAAPAAAPEPPVALALPQRATALEQQVVAQGIADAIDPDLFDIFREEAQDLFAGLSAAMRQWASHPDNAAARTQAMRLLHTLKGGARLSGAMRLGAMAHEMETAMGALDAASLSSTHIEPLQLMLDDMDLHFVQLCNPVQDAPPAPAPEPVPAPPPAAATVAAAPEADAAQHGEQADALVPELFAVFREEAQDLFVHLSAAMRQWASRPENHGARTEAMRLLHTLKGGARLSGAMRLGAMTHEMETAVGALGTSIATPAQLEPLQGMLDDMERHFHLLCNPAAAAAAPGAVAAAPPAALPQQQPQQQAPATAPAAAPAAAAAGAAGAAQQQQQVRVRSVLLDRMLGQTGEVITSRARLDAEVAQLRRGLGDMDASLERLRQQLRDMELQAETQMQSRMAASRETHQNYDPLEFDRYTRVQELTRMMAESVDDVATVRRTLQRAVQASEDDLNAQERQTKELQRDLLRTRMVEFESIAERLHRVVRQAARESGKQVSMDIVGGSIDMDRSVLERVIPAFEHVLRNAVVHGIEEAQTRQRAGKDATGRIEIRLQQEGNDVAIALRDDGAGLNLPRILSKARSSGLLPAAQERISDHDAAQLIFSSGFTTADAVTSLAGRGVGMDVVRNEINALGGRIEVSTKTGQGSVFTLVLPLTTAVTQVVELRMGAQRFGVPSHLIEGVRRSTAKDIQNAYNTQHYDIDGEKLPFYWAGALVQWSRRSEETPTRRPHVVVLRSAAQRIVVHVDEVLGAHEVVVKHIGPQLARMPGLSGITILPNGELLFIYNPVALSMVYGDQIRAYSADKADPAVLGAGATHLVSDEAPAAPAQPPLVMVVDDSITVRRVTERLLKREGFRVALAVDGMAALKTLGEGDELPSVILSDIEMPNMDGFDLLRNIRADARTAQLPVVMITSRTADKHRAHAVELGASEYLGKPYSEERLLGLLRQYSARPIHEAMTQ